MGLFQPGQQVIRTGAAGEIGIVVGGPMPLRGQDWYRVSFGNRIESVGEASLSPRITGNDPLDTQALSPAALRKRVIAQKVVMGLGDVLYSLAASRTQLHPYQYKPLIKLLESNWRRMLVADEVGLGKTIEAGFIALERIAREPESRVLVVCPAILRTKWQKELGNRFDLHFDIPATDVLVRRVAEGQDVAADPPLRLIVSYEQIRADRFIEAFDPEYSRLDLLVVDEAHRARNRFSQQSQAVSALTQHADWAVYLTATPIMTSEEDLWSLLRLLLESQFPSLEVYRIRAMLNRYVVAAERAVDEGTASGLERAIAELESAERADYRQLLANQESFMAAKNALRSCADRYGQMSRAERAEARLEAMSRLFDVNMLSPFFSRTRRRDVHSKFARRKVIIADVPPGPEEKRVYDRLSRAIFLEYRARKGTWPAVLTLSTYRAQIASSLSGAVRRLRGFIGTRFELDDSDLAATSSIREGKNSGEAGAESLCESVARVLAEADPELLERVDSKWSVFEALLAGRYNEPGDPPIGKIVVFAFYKHSLDVIGRHLDRAGVRYVRIDGGVDSSTRSARVDQFKEDRGVRILLTSQVGGEGIDLQVANTVVNWDLPWNPMQVEQRIGRVDRLGQISSVIYVVNMAMQDTIEARVVSRLQQRIHQFVSNIGNLEEILGPLMSELEERALSTQMTVEEMDREQERVMAVALNAVRTQQQVESNVDAFLGQEQFLADRVGRLKAEGRYVSGPELREYVEERLQVVDPESYMRQLPGGRRYELRVGAVLKRQVKSCMPRANQDWFAFLRKVDAGILEACFPLDGEEVSQDVELLSVNHPLVRTLASLDTPEREGAIFCEGVIQSDRWRAGDYLLVAAIHHDRARKRSSRLLSASVPLDGTDALHPHDSDEMLVAFLDNGAAHVGSVNRELRHQAYQRAQIELTARIADLQQREASRAAERRARDLAIIEAESSQALSRERQRLDERSHPHAPENLRRTVPLLKARIAKLEARRADQLAKVSEVSAPEWQNRELAVVCITVWS